MFKSFLKKLLLDDNTIKIYKIWKKRFEYKVIYVLRFK